MRPCAQVGSDACLTQGRVCSAEAAYALSVWLTLACACCCEEGTEEKEAAPFPMRDVIARPASTAPSSYPMDVRARPKSSQSWRRASQQLLRSVPPAIRVRLRSDQKGR